MKKIIAVVLVLAVVAGVVYLFLRGNGFGFGNGDGTADSLAANTPDTPEEPETPEQPEEPEEPETPEEPGGEDGTVTVTVREDKVIVNGQEFTDADSLSAYIEEINSDDRTFELEEDNAILSTYEWAVKVFEDLSIPIKTEAE